LAGRDGQGAERQVGAEAGRPARDES